MSKVLVYHVYDPDDNPVGSWRDVSNSLSYAWPLNTGPRAVTLDLSREWGTAGEPGEEGSAEDLANGNRVKVYALDRDSGPDGVLVYQGIIREVRFSLGRGVTRVQLIPIASIQQEEWIEGPVTLTNYDPAAMMRYFLDNGYMPGLAWDETNPPVGALHSETFEREKLGQVMETIRSLAGGTWYWTITPAQKLVFRSWDLNAAPNHTLMLDRETFEGVEFVKSQLGTKKRVLFYGASGVTATATASDYDAEAPQDLPISNQRVTDVSTAQRIANAYLEQHNRTFYATTLPIVDNNLAPSGLGYDIERLRPGETVALSVPDLVLAAPKWDEENWDEFDLDGSELAAIQDAFVIAEVTYAPDAAVLKLEQRPLSTTRELVNVSDRLLLTETA